MIGMHVVGELVEVERIAARLVLVAPARQVDGARREAACLRAGDGTHTQIELEVTRQPLHLARDLFEQRSTHEPRSDQADRYRVAER